MSSKRNPDAKDDWQTPANLAELVTDFATSLGFDGITLDPATTQENPMGAEYIRTPECDPDGIHTEWFSSLDQKPRFVWVNPPYRQPWYRKIIQEALLKTEGSHLVALLPAKVGTGYFQDIAGCADAVVFVRGRLTFRGAEEPAPFESALVYFGRSPFAFLAHFGKLGWGLRC